MKQNKIFEKLQLTCMILDIVWSMIGCSKEDVLSALISEHEDYFIIKRGNENEVKA